MLGYLERLKVMQGLFMCYRVWDGMLGESNFGACLWEREGNRYEMNKLICKNCGVGSISKLTLLSLLLPRSRRSIAGC